MTSFPRPPMVVLCRPRDCLSLLLIFPVIFSGDFLLGIGGDQDAGNSYHGLKVVLAFLN